MKENIKLGCGPSIFLSPLFILILIAVLGNFGYTSLGHKILEIYLWVFGILMTITSGIAGLFLGAMMTDGSSIYSDEKIRSMFWFGFFATFTVLMIGSVLYGCFIYYIGVSICL